MESIGDPLEVACCPSVYQRPLYEYFPSAVSESLRQRRDSPVDLLPLAQEPPQPPTKSVDNRPFHPMR